MMRRFKRSLASLLAAVMLVSSLPAALAVEPEEEVLPPEQPVEDSAENSGELYYFQSMADPEQTAVPNEDGAYILILRQGTQFPCEVALFDPAVEDEDEAYFSVIFENDTDPVEAGGRTFLPQASEEAEEEDPSADPYSLLPLKEYTFNVDLSKYVGSELEAVKLEDVLTEPASGNTSPVSHYTSGQTVVWGEQRNEDRFTIAKGTETIDLSEFIGQGRVSLELIVGSGDQFDPNNIRCLVTATLADLSKLIGFKAKTNEGQLSISSARFSSIRDENRNYIDYYRLSSDLSFWDKDDVKLSLAFNDNAAEGIKSLTAVVYSGYYNTEEEALAADAQVISDIWSSSAEGHSENYSEGDYSPDPSKMPKFTVVLKRGDTSVYTLPFGVYIPCSDPYSLLDFELYASDNSKIPTSDFSSGYSSVNGIRTRRYYANAVSASMESISASNLVMMFRSGNSDATGVTVEKVSAGRSDITSTIWKDSSVGSVPAGHRGDYTDYQNTPQFQVVLKKGEKTVALDFSVIISEFGISVSMCSHLYADNSSSRSTAGRLQEQGTPDKEGQALYICSLDSSAYSAIGTYYLNLSLYNSAPGADTSNNGITYVERAVLGDFTTAEEIKKQPDIKGKLFETASSYTVNTGYAAEFESSGPVEFTVLDAEGGIHRFAVKLEEYTLPLSGSTYLRMNYAKSALDGSAYKYYAMQSSDDSYYEKGYQTIFLLNTDGTAVNAEKIRPVFFADSGATIYLGLDQKSGTPQISGESEIPFTAGVPQPYSAASEDRHLDNYQVTFLTQQTGAKLFVNAVSNSAHKVDGVAQREVKLTYPDAYHDILLANIGKEELSGLSVSLTENPLIQLDEYWTIQSDNAKKLAGFTTTEKVFTNDEGKPQQASYSELPNLAKVRLTPILDTDGNIQSGVVDATLTINSENGGNETVKLTGLSGRLGITTREMNPGVKYVPYSQLIQTNALRGAGNVVFELVEGVLPSGLRLYEDGEIYGAPQETGEWTFTVRAYFSGYEADTVQREFTIEIADNTDENVYLATTNADYQLETPIGMPTGNYHYVLDNLQDQIYKSKGEYPKFVALWLDGEKLPGSAYSAASGSTVITIWGETIAEKDDGTGKSHTIAAEFREGGSERNGELKETSQNFVISLSSSGPNLPAPPDSSNPGTGSKPSGSSGSNTQKPNQPDTSGDKPATPGFDSSATPETPAATPFVDVQPTNWFYDDVKWAYDAGLVTGMTTTTFVPEDPISQATVVTLLARMAKVDLTQFDGTIPQDIEPGQWYTNAAIWAKQSGLLPNYSTFQGTGPFSRSQMAIMLVKYLRSLGIDTSVPEVPLVFADADLMSAEENDAFQVLYRYGIFKGIGDMYMDPAGVTTRAQFVALLHRISVFIESK